MVTTEDNLFQQKLQAILERFESLTRSLSDPAVIADQARFKKLAKDRSEISELVDRYEEYRNLLKNIEETREVLEEAGGDDDLLEMARTEKEDLDRKKTALEEILQLLMLPRDPNDDKNIFLEIRAGTGGEEAGLFVGELFRMYSRFAENKGWRTEMVTSNPTGIGGFKEVIVLIEGKGAFRDLKYESGVHRVQRVPVTEAGGRVHTSAVTVAVIPEAEEVDIKVEAKDLRIDTFCSSGPGGQSVNTTYSAVRITHVPTGTVVTCQDEKSQIKNKAKAMRVLRSRILEVEQARQQDEIAQNRKIQVGSGDRSEKIRTYNFPQNRVTDHRIGLTLHRLTQVLEGDLGEIVAALTSADQAERLKTAMA
ncbi:MAG TPA: peptide chain release factor 1 [Nitrospiria bacterium]